MSLRTRPVASACRLMAGSLSNHRASTVWGEAQGRVIPPADGFDPPTGPQRAGRLIPAHLRGAGAVGGDLVGLGPLPRRQPPPEGGFFVRDQPPSDGQDLLAA